MKRNRTQQKIATVAAHPGALHMPATALANVCKVGVRTASKAQSLAEEQSYRDSAVRRRVLALRNRDRLLVTVREAEEKYPGILLLCARTRQYGNVVRDYRLPITKQRVGQIAKDLRALANILGYAPSVVASAAKFGQLPKTIREQYER